MTPDGDRDGGMPPCPGPACDDGQDGDVIREGRPPQPYGTSGETAAWAVSPVTVRRRRDVI
ncbi:MAG: hypothetical protein RDU30_03925 [Desulfovibrionaceae bacterium]|nr:hypothetical protein [Desulfovibrionaceae bacterium]